MKLQRATLLVRIAITLALALGVMAASSAVSFSSPGLAKDGHGHGHSGKSHKPGKDKSGKGHKEHKQKHDNGKHKGKNQDNGKHKGKKDKKEKRVKAEPLALYSVQVDCTYDSSLDQSTCVFDADNPPGAKKINLIDLPADELCAPVVGGDTRFVDPDPNTGVTGYRSTDSDARFTLVLSGEVMAGDTAIYWIKAANDVFPVTGTGLRCIAEQPAAAQTEATAPAPTATAEPTTTASTAPPEVTDTTGSVVVNSFSCPIASPQTDYDWYGQCAPQAAGFRYRLMRIDTDTRDGVTTSTDDTGRATFRMLPPGTYELTQAEGDWCFAQSDDVDPDGNLTVEAGNRTTVWVFICAGSG